MSTGIAIKGLIKAEQKAQTDYSKAKEAADKKKNKKAASVFGHIKTEEREHESMLKRVRT